MRVESNEQILCQYKPVWSLPSSKFGNNRWIVFSIRLLRLIILYSDLEYDHWVLVESNSRIVLYCEQPLRVRVKLPSGFVTPFLICGCGLIQVKRNSVKSNIVNS
ncbi:MAG: hypothetical protein QOF62_323 [Pyrinomonadaceae bacterium]|jgi:hypothetical protein|nr:hypothetical protein [Pyrinomonadaceae bacterium]